MTPTPANWRSRRLQGGTRGSRARQTAALRPAQKITRSGGAVTEKCSVLVPIRYPQKNPLVFLSPEETCSFRLNPIAYVTKASASRHKPQVERVGTS